MPRVRVQLADGSFKNVNLTREELVLYNTTGKLSGDIVNQDNLLLNVLKQNGVLETPAVNTIRNTEGDLKDFVSDQDNLVAFLSSYKTVQEETNGVKTKGDAILMEVAENAPQIIKNKYSWSDTINFENKLSGSTTVDLLAGELPPGFGIRDTSNNSMTNNTLVTSSKSVVVHGTTDSTAVSDYIDSGSIDPELGFIKHHPSELDVVQEDRIIELLDVEYIDNNGDVIENPSITFGAGESIFSDNYQDNWGGAGVGESRKSRTIEHITTYTENGKTKTKFILRETIETPVTDDSGNPVIVDGSPMMIKDRMSFSNRDQQWAFLNTAQLSVARRRKRISYAQRFFIISLDLTVRARYYDAVYADDGKDRSLAKNFYFQLGVKYEGQSDYSDKKWFVIVCVNNYDGTRDIMLQSLNKSLLSETFWLPIRTTGTVGDGGREFDLQVYFEGDQPSADYYYNGDIKNIIADYDLPFTDTSGTSHTISVKNEVLPFHYYSAELVLGDGNLLTIPNAFILENGQIEWEINLSGTKYYKTQQLSEST
mgnify:CR=1 FL=1